VAKIVLVHGAFNELWGPHEIEAQWLPARRDGLWHRGRRPATETSPCASTATCSGAIRRRPTRRRPRRREHVAAVVARRLRKLGTNLDANLGGDPPGQALFDRTVDHVTTMATVPAIRARVLERLDALGSG
jgi:hypothetical protein